MRTVERVSCSMGRFVRHSFDYPRDRHKEAEHRGGRETECRQRDQVAQETLGCKRGRKPTDKDNTASSDQ